MPRRIQRDSICCTRLKQRIAMDGSLIENGEEIGKEFNKYLSVFSQEESDRKLEPVQIFKGQEVDK